MASSSPSSTQDRPLPPQAIPISSSVTVASRRLPPPCWSHDETVALIEAYRDKWYSLRRGNLRANHWQEVADDVAARCPVNNTKTAVQCRHKMEKLRKRYRAEIQRAAPFGGARSYRYCSAWVHFKLMDAMERGPNASPPAEEEEPEDEKEDFRQHSVKRIGDLYNSNPHRDNIQGSMNNGGSGFRIKIGNRSGLSPPMGKMYAAIDEFGVQNPNSSYNPSSNFKSSKVSREGFGGRNDLGKRVSGEGTGGERKKTDPVAEMVTALRMLGDGFVRMEKMKMDMARKLEEMRMETEIKRTEMILESQQKIVEAFAKGFSERNHKKAKRMPTPES